ncbi:SGNH/GDSL hydrolase family protein [Hymenobacter nivis]|uniref:SGNH/GDSL hydrolase family protein n=1 Tax=Hymenobacter nivis TaxID=1850093 RepID=A0A502HFI0_9BACT|nr:SGNH/GDSL hydrolase family protein [Hymenobacter nivis]TPG71998.1 SGNH/GDSL hydrolase family protein [Hymenobacter nivis]
MLPEEFSSKYQAVFADNEFQNITEATFRAFAEDIRATFAPAGAQGTLDEAGRLRLFRGTSDVPQPVTQDCFYLVDKRRIVRAKSSFNASVAPTGNTAYWEVVLEVPAAVQVLDTTGTSTVATMSQRVLSEMLAAVGYTPIALNEFGIHPALPTRRSFEEFMMRKVMGLGTTVAPGAPANGFVNDEANTFSFDVVPGYETLEEYEATGFPLLTGFQPLTSQNAYLLAKRIYIRGLAGTIEIGAVAVRVAESGSRPAGGVLRSTERFTGPAVVANAAPDVTISSPAPGVLVTAGATLALVAVATDDKAVQSLQWLNAVGGVIALGVKNGNQYSASMTVPSTAGGFPITAKAIDAEGLFTTAEVTVTIQAATTTPDPTITPDAPDVAFDVTSRILSASHPSYGTADLEYRHGGTGTVLAYAAIGVDSGAHAASEWQYRVKAATGRTASIWAGSPSIAAVAVNQLPVANAGSDTTVQLPTNAAQLQGSGSDPDPGDTITYSWSQSSGPNSATFSSKTVATPTVSGLIAGAYTFHLITTDNHGAVSLDDAVLVTVNAAAVAGRKLLIGTGDSTMRDTNTPGATTGYTGNTGPGWWDVMVDRLALDSAWETVNLGYAGKSPGWVLTNRLDELKGYLDFSKYSQVIVVLGFPGGNGITNQFGRSAAQEVADLKALAQAAKSVNAAKTRTVPIPYVNRNDSYAIATQDATRQNVNTGIQNDNSGDFDVKPLASSQLRVFQSSYPTDPTFSYDGVHFTGSGGTNGHGGAGVVGELAAQGVAQAAGLTLANPAYRQNLDYAPPTTTPPEDGSGAGPYYAAKTSANNKYIELANSVGLATSAFFMSGVFTISNYTQLSMVLAGILRVQNGDDSTAGFFIYEPVGGSAERVLRASYRTNQGQRFDDSLGVTLALNKPYWLAIKAVIGQPVKAWIGDVNAGTLTPYAPNGTVLAGALQASTVPLMIGAGYFQDGTTRIGFVDQTVQDFIFSKDEVTDEQVDHAFSTTGGKRRGQLKADGGAFNLSTPGLIAVSSLLSTSQNATSWGNLVDSTRGFSLKNG